MANKHKWMSKIISHSRNRLSQFPTQWDKSLLVHGHRNWNEMDKIQGWTSASTILLPRFWGKKAQISCLSRKKLKASPICIDQWRMLFRQSSLKSSHKCFAYNSAWVIYVTCLVYGVGEIGQHIKTLAAFAEDPGLVPWIYLVAHNCDSSFRDSDILFQLWVVQRKVSRLKFPFSYKWCEKLFLSWAERIPGGEEQSSDLNLCL